ncbi:MAG: type II secretion system major pseudopilin GspG [Verrucomicrobia bacterium]|nr:type II secretion system major pseudopilin GspG [Verrucomicrobiota bacterium]MCG2679299.1 type II secretion system major pseudopilin GspG [Kiritimatiellia bacterium]MBU4247324.1 type II secretion system major pseudopilin GspG [Verrucomicrobiota bacterium]MBU4292264.1 type II secretion system major pseudopilin GspG [Verrucomicrobiota bacterium]MBU4428284.1 type II secretion system major pseudopilin GspG [Verrucomicrobiota bacterium]
MSKQREVGRVLRNTGIRQCGFTLIEVLLVVVIIGILAAIVVPRLGGRTKEAQVAAAKASIDGISLAIDQYEVDNGSYPPSMQALITKGSELNWKGPYLKKSTIPLDPWGKEYLYTPKENGYDIKSLGPNGVEGGDDVTN